MNQPTLFDAEIRALIAEARANLDIAIARHVNDPWERAQSAKKAARPEGETDK